MYMWKVLVLLTFFKQQHVIKCFKRQENKLEMSLIAVIDW